jgi:fumarylacetoacetate (FAA) hydrolase
MRLASLRDSSRDGSLIVVSQDGLGFAPARAIAKNLQVALDSWDDTLPLLHGLALDLERGNVESHKLQPTSLLAPLPRAYEWIDGSAYLHHVRLVRKTRGAEPPESLTTDPLVYQGGSGVLLAPTADLPLPDPSWGLDFEAEVCIVVGDTPLGVNAVEAEKYIRLVLLANDVTFRSLVPSELKKGFGFVQSKPASAFSPFALTPDELGEHFRDGRLHLPLETSLNGQLVGSLNAGTHMHFSFCDLIAHAAKTRSLTAGTIIGSGTVSAAEGARSEHEFGISCLAERRMIEIIEAGAATTSYLSVGDQVRIEMRDPVGRNLFGSIEQRVVAA